MTSTQALRTSDALTHAGIERGLWNSLVQREILKDLPAAVPGRAGRSFGVDDLVQLEVFAELLRIGVRQDVAGQVADRLRALMRLSKSLEKLYLVTVPAKDGTHVIKLIRKPPEDSSTLWIIDVAKGRELARAKIAKLNPEA